MENTTLTQKVLITLSVVQTIIMSISVTAFLSQIDQAFFEVGRIERKAKDVWERVDKHLDQLHCTK